MAGCEAVCHKRLREKRPRDGSDALVGDHVAR